MRLPFRVDKARWTGSNASRALVCQAHRRPVNYFERSASVSITGEITWQDQDDTDPPEQGTVWGAPAAASTTVAEAPQLDPLTCAYTTCTSTSTSAQTPGATAPIPPQPDQHSLLEAVHSSSLADASPTGAARASGQSCTTAHTHHVPVPAVQHASVQAHAQQHSAATQAAPSPNIAAQAVLDDQTSSRALAQSQSRQSQDDPHEPRAASTPQAAQPVHAAEADQTAPATPADQRANSSLSATSVDHRGQRAAGSVTSAVCKPWDMAVSTTASGAPATLSTLSELRSKAPPAFSAHALPLSGQSWQIAKRVGTGDGIRVSWYRCDLQLHFSASCRV